MSRPSPEPPRWTQTKAGLTISLPPHAALVDLVLCVALDRDAGSIPLARLGGDSLTSGATATASNVYESDSDYSADKAIDGDPDTRWATDAGTHSAWLQVDLGKPQLIGSAEINEAYAGRIQEFELEAMIDGHWWAIAHGTGVGPNRKIAFPPVRTQSVRLNIIRATEGPTISEFKLFGPVKKVRGGK